MRCGRTEFWWMSLAVLKPKLGGQFPYPSRYGSTVLESAASGSSYSLPTITEVFEQSSVSVGSVGDDNERQMLRLNTPQGAPDGERSLKGTVPEDLLTLGQLKAKFVATQRM